MTESRFDLDEIFEADAREKRKKKSTRMEISLRQYIELVEKDPRIAQNAYARHLENIIDAGVEPIPPQEQWLGCDKRYLLFQDLYGLEVPIYQLVNFIRGGDYRSSTSKNVVVLIGPPASGKSTAARILAQALENYSKRPVFRIKGCPKFEEPLHLLPRKMRKEIKKRPEDCPECSAMLKGEPDRKLSHLHLGVTIEGDLCPYCRHVLLDQYKRADGTPNYWDIPVETFTFSIQARRGITSYEPPDDKTSDITKLTGPEDIYVTQSGSKEDWKTFDIGKGEIPRAERGQFEIRETFACDEEILTLFYSVAQERELKIHGSNFPHLSVDTLILGHTNLQALKDQEARKKKEGLHNRFFLIDFGYPLFVKKEIKVYKKLVEIDSDFVSLGKCHIAPGSLELAALFAVATRVNESGMGISIFDKVKAYNGEAILTERDKEKKPIDLRELLAEGQKAEDRAKRDGMFGVGPRTIMAAINSVLSDQVGRNGCLTPGKVLRALHDVWKHQMGFSPEDVKRYQLLLESVANDEYKKLVVESVKRAFLGAYGDLARKRFDEYVAEAQYDQDLKNPYSVSANLRYDDAGKPKEPNFQLLRSVEVHVPVTEAEASIFRRSVLVYKAGHSDFSHTTYSPLAKAVDESFFEETKGMLTSVLTPDKPKGEEEKLRARNLRDDLLTKGYCKICAEEYLKKAHEFING